MEKEEDDHAQVIIRLKPELGEESKRLSIFIFSTLVLDTDACLKVIGEKIITSVCDSSSEEVFEFDYIAREDTTQGEIFARFGLPLVENCMKG